MIFSVLIFTNVTSCLGNSRLKDYDGDIVMLYPNPGGGFPPKACNLIYTPKTNNYLYVNKGNGYSDVSFSDDKEKILGLEWNYTIVEYDLKTNSSTIVFNDEIKGAIFYSDLKYVPKSDCISFNAYPNLYIYNPKTKEKNIVIKASGEYAWSKDGKKLFYGILGKPRKSTWSEEQKKYIISKPTESKIYCLDVESKISTLYIENGYGPQLSPDNNYIAFERDKKLIVREIKTGKEWSYKPKIKICNYKFSPDNKYLALIEEYPPKNIFDNINNEVKLISWDFKKNRKVTLVKGVFQSNFDWK
ncbi:MAG: hypothetical protein GXY86_16750 [Firmicutes bacterium]|nr:hypothetical protein [Bacillota bacterium]